MLVEQLLGRPFESCGPDGDTNSRRGGAVDLLRRTTALTPKALRQCLSHEPAEHVLEIVTPRTNAARLSAAEHLFGTLVLGRQMEARARSRWRSSPTPTSADSCCEQPR